MNHGDDGLLEFFKAVYDTLEANGMFILEPQDWKSYQKYLAKATHLKLRPFESEDDKASFQFHLINTIGFRELVELRPASGSKDFESRPVWVCLK